MYKISIIHEDKTDDFQLKELFQKYEKDHKVHFLIYEYSSAELYFESNDVDSDLILIQIKDETKLGFETAKRIRNANVDTLIMFFSDSKRYALIGYDYGAIGYLVSPIEWEKFTSCIKRAVFILRRTLRRKIRIRSIQGLFIVPLSEILYVEVQKHTLFYYLHPKSVQKHRILKVRGSSLQEAEEFLQRYDFARCNGSCMVNLNYVMAIMNNTLYIPEAMLTISRVYKESFQDNVIKYLNERDVWNI